MGTEMTAHAAMIATVIIEPGKGLGMMISSREKQERNQGRRQLVHSDGLLEPALG
jgi:hypothetical protein